MSSSCSCALVFLGVLWAPLVLSLRISIKDLVYRSEMNIPSLSTRVVQFQNGVTTLDDARVETFHHYTLLCFSPMTGYRVVDVKFGIGCFEGEEYMRAIAGLHHTSAWEN